jgi:hypothetical protein
MGMAVITFKKQPIFFIWLLLVVVTIGYIVFSARSLESNDPRYIAIENTLQEYLNIDAEARYTLDDSRLSEVLANDLLGSYDPGAGRSHLAQAVRWNTGNPNVSDNHIGMLDFWQAYYAYQRQVKQIYDDAVAQGKIDPYSNDGTVSLESLPEIRQLMEQTGFQTAQLPPAQPANSVPISFAIRTIKVFWDEAYVVGDYPYARVGMTFVKHAGQWYLVGMSTLQQYGG